MAEINGPIPSIAAATTEHSRRGGLRLTETPFTPEKVWRALQEAGIS